MSTRLSDPMVTAILKQLLSRHPELLDILQKSILETSAEGGGLGLEPLTAWIQTHPEEFKNIAIGIIASNLPGGTAASMLWDVASNEAVKKTFREKWVEMGIDETSSDQNVLSMKGVLEVVSNSATMAYFEGYRTASNFWGKKVAVKSKL